MKKKSASKTAANLDSDKKGETDFQSPKNAPVSSRQPGSRRKAKLQEKQQVQVAKACEKTSLAEPKKILSPAPLNSMLP